MHNPKQVKFPYSTLLAIFFGCVIMAITMTQTICSYKIKIEQLRGAK